METPFKILATPLQIVCFVGHAYQPHLPIAVRMFSAHAQKNWSGIGVKVANECRYRHLSLRYDAAQAHWVP